MQQVEVEETARWYSGIGCVFSDDFAQKHVGAQRMKELDMQGAYVYHFDEPHPCFYVTFGAGGSWTFDLPVAKQMTVSRTEAEGSRLSQFVGALDPDNRFGLRPWNFHLDLSRAKKVRKPTDEEISRMHLEYRDDKKTNAAKRRTPMKTTDEERMEREIRALDRRRFRDAGLVPPHDRCPNEAAMHKLREGPNRMPCFSKTKMDGYRSDTSEEEYKTWNARSPIRCAAIGLFDDEDVEVDEEGNERVKPDPDLIDDAVIFEDKEMQALELEEKFREPVAQKKPPTKRRRSGKTILEGVLKSMRAKSRQKYRP